MEKPEKRILEKESIYFRYDKGYNHGLADMEDYHNFKMKEAKDRLPTEENIEEIITTYFVLDKRWLRCKGRTILFDENDSNFLAEEISKQIRGVR